ETSGAHGRRLFACAHSRKAGPLTEFDRARARTIGRSVKRRAPLASPINCVPRHGARLCRGPFPGLWVPGALPCRASPCPDHAAAAVAGPLLAEVAASDTALAQRSA